MILKNASVLVIDDDQDVLTAVRLLLKTEVREVLTEKNPDNIRLMLSKQTFDLILLDMNFNSPINTGNEGLFWLKKIREFKSDAEVIMITAYGDIDLAVRSVKESAADFILKPWHNEKLLAVIRETLSRKENKKNTNAVTENDAVSGIIGSSESIKDIFYKIEKIAPTDANILILGENGTGKDLVAKAIHEKSLRNNNSFVKIDMGSLTESLFESELFGYKKGAFTDAKEDRTGRFEAANGGTLFLDEIGNISLQQQSKLLSVLQNRQVIRLGDNVPKTFDARLICATNLPIQELANESRFRKDLVYRINTVEIILPPLRNRGEDILELAGYFTRFYSGKYLKSGFQFDKSARDKLSSYGFPGNVRELRYIIERAVIMSESEVLSESDIIFSPIEARKETENPEGELKLSAVEKNTILRVIEKHKGNISKAARELGLTRTALYRRLNKYDI